jgi:glucose/arabinose dehydrogenase
MVQLLSLGALALPFLANFVSATPLEREKRQSTATQVVKQASIENLATRSNGLILDTNVNSPNLYLVDPVAKTSKTGVVVTGASGLSGIREYTPDIFAVINEGKAIYKVDFSGATPSASLIKAIDEAGTLNGLAVLDADTVLVADATKGQIWRFTSSIGASSVAFADPTMKDTAFGIDGLKYANGTVWYTNLLKNSFYKVAVDAAGKATGTPTAIWTNSMGDDLCFGPNGKVYVSTNSGEE